MVIRLYIYIWVRVWQFVCFFFLTWQPNYHQWQSQFAAFFNSSISSLTFADIFFRYILCVTFDANAFAVIVLFRHSMFVLRSSYCCWCCCCVAVLMALQHLRSNFSSFFFTIHSCHAHMHRMGQNFLTDTCSLQRRDFLSPMGWTGEPSSEFRKTIPISRFQRLSFESSRVINNSFFPPLPTKKKKPLQFFWHHPVCVCSELDFACASTSYIE